MKSFMVLGATLGFLISLLLALAQGSPAPSALWHACVAALAIGWLMRWWHRMWLRNLRAALEQRLAALAAERQKSKAATPNKV